MMQLKAIFSVLLLDWEFELAQPSDTYRNDHSKMVVQLAAALRGPLPTAGGRRSGAASRERGLMRVVVDLDLCQGHGVCESEAPTVFELAKRRPWPSSTTHLPTSGGPRSRPPSATAPHPPYTSSKRSSPCRRSPAVSSKR